MVTVFSIGRKLNCAEDLTAMCLHRDVHYHKLIVLLTNLCLGISLICITNVYLNFVLFFMKIRNLEGHHNIVRNDIKLLLLNCYQAKMYSSKIYVLKK